MKKNHPTVSLQNIENIILLIRGQKVILDADLAVLYGTSTKALNQAIKRNRNRFPADFMFELTEQEKSEVVTICDHLAKLKFSSTLPHVFTEHGVVMAASVLNTPKAIQVSIYVIRVFIKLRQMLIENKNLALQMMKLEKKIKSHDIAIHSLIAAISNITTPSHPARRKKIGFK
ncbi:MAG: hypothetical protein A2X86_10065 [Bdellovibrionales bacterium GWA2_49_15]|nr:MAG: hypothetical protein A2X86_10065 [Bdellovibrionales bacterium GWA2_49_15]HAZ14238.1 hypothetical protein [Bdellovibrionales bacterium]